MDASLTTLTPDTPATNGNGSARSDNGRPRAGRPAQVLRPWLATQVLNARRHATALRPFRRTEFGDGPAAPTEAHIQAVNALMARLQRELLGQIRGLAAATRAARQQPDATTLAEALRHKELAHAWVQSIEKVWDFYFELFGQRQTRYADWLLGCDRVARDCYQVAYRGLAVARTVPTPPPFAYMRTGFSPATYRRSIPLRSLGQQKNPFPLIQMPYHRLVNPWTMGAMLHEVSHNLQNDLGLAGDVPKAIARRLLQAGYPASVAAVWVHWNRELFADVCGMLLGGPSFVPSLMDVVGRSARTVYHYRPRAPHPTPYLRVFISLELMRRMGFGPRASPYRQAWERLYPDPQNGSIPPAVLKTAREVIPLVVDTVCYQPYPSLGQRSLAGVLRFAPKDQQMVEEAAERLARGVDPGIVPARFLIGAARVALDRRLAAPHTLAHNFYQELARR